MRAVQERIVGRAGETLEVIWHKPVGRVVEEFQAIACDTETGITLPGGKRDVPAKLDKPGERWCSDCVATSRQKKEG